MWGRMVSCGGLSTRLPTSVQKPPRPIDNRPQIDNLPHIRRLRGSKVGGMAQFGGRCAVLQR